MAESPSEGGRDRALVFQLFIGYRVTRTSSRHSEACRLGAKVFALDKAAIWKFEAKGSTIRIPIAGQGLHLT